MEKTALLIIDVQAGIRALFKDAQPNSWETVIANNRALLDAFAAGNLPVYKVRVQPKIFPRKWREAFSHLLITDTGASVHELIKHGPSAFKNSDFDLDAALKSAGVENVVVTGCSTENGVLKTVRDAASLGFKVAIISDASAARNRARHEKALRGAANFAEILTTAEMIEK